MEREEELEQTIDELNYRLTNVLKNIDRLKLSIKQAIEEIEKTENTQEHTSYDGDINIKGAFNDGMEKALEILKRNVGE